MRATQMHWPAFITFASEATHLAFWAGGFLLLAVYALVAEKRRAKRRDIDRVGYMPWTLVFLVSAFVGSGLLVVAVKGWVAG
ncbi:hypothetical protein [Alteraurantiacibacter aquimixticola]|uniref:Uncharacterized protein n=1 Tax=Alteraurantiacibacter aquimixticola TaxID=2489173 RepID=A0A4T3F7X3_9SPHN|nr:hypothetical protein [Alteraurantiacibacter aquimixticola]TIX51832.1 hypothetical protein E5222_05155 [Alteraurantiacibacter aquimixticola]